MDRSNQNQNCNHDEETMDWLLDDYWDRRNAGTRPTSADRALDHYLAATVHHLHAHDDAPGPDRAFVRRLRKDLTMITAEPIALSPRPYPSLAPPDGQIPNAVARPHREASRWRPALELIAAAVLVVALISGYFGSDRVRTGMHALLQIDDSPGPTAMWHGNPARTGEMPGPGPDGEPGLLWRASVFGEEDSPRSAPMVAGDTIYMTSHRYEAGRLIISLSAVDVATGQVRWSVDVGEGNQWGSPAIAEGFVYVGTTSYAGEASPGTPSAGGVATPAPLPAATGALIAYDAETGEEQWRYETGGSSFSSPAVVDGVVYVESQDGSLHAVDAVTGRRKWLAAVPLQAGTGSVASPAVADGMVYTAGNMGVLYALDAETGEVRWTAQTKGTWAQMPVVSDGRVYVAISKSSGPANGWLAAFDAVSGNELWSHEFGYELAQAPVVSGDKVVLNTGMSGGAIVAYNAETGDVAWTFPTDDRVSGTPVVVDGVLYVGAFDNRVYALDADTGQEIWHVELAFWVYSSPAVADGAIFVIGDGELYALGGTAPLPGTPVATPLPNGDASGLPPCTADLRPEWDDLPLVGEPAASLVPVTEGQQYGQPAGAKESDLPTGPPADAETVSAIKETLTQMIPCARPGREQQLATFYSDDYFRRTWVLFNLHYNRGYRSLWPPPSPDDFDVNDTRILPDGRIGVLVMRDEQSGGFLVFVQQGDRWLIDERIEISDTGEGHG